MSAPITAFAALIDIGEEKQCEEIEEYLRSKGAEITSSDETDLLTRLQQIVQECHLVFQDKDLQPQEVEGFFYSIVSLFHIVPPDRGQEFIDLMCQKVTVSASKENGAFKLRLLGLMASHFNVKDPLVYTVFCHRVRLARDLGLHSLLSVNMETLKEWVVGWRLSGPQVRTLYQLVWDALRHSGNKTLSSSVLTELLKTYSPSDASDATELAKQLVVLSVSDPEQFVFDHLLSLEPIKLLQSQRIYQLLNIFVSERLADFLKFYNANEEFVDGLGLDYSYCVRKIRLLTLMSLAVESHEVPFQTLTSELELPEQEFEMLILDAIRLKLLEARINQVTQQLVVTSSLHRTFQVEQWRTLHSRLSLWKQNIHTVKSSLGTIKT